MTPNTSAFASDSHRQPLFSSFGGLAALFLSFCTAGCASWFTYSVPPNPDKYHLAEHGWLADARSSDDSIYFRLYRTSEPTAANPSLPTVTVDCRSCNLIEEPLPVQFDPTGTARVFIPEARQLLSVRLHIHGSGIDTTFVQKQPAPEQATSIYKLATPLKGRVLVTQLAILAPDTTLDRAICTAQIGDELNIFGERSGFYLVHHPLFHEPLYLLKENAVRIN